MMLSNRTVTTILIVLFSVGLLMGVSGAVSAQNTTSTAYITGTVTDDSGNSLAAVEVTVSDDTGETIRTVETTSNGEFTTEVPPGEYEVSASATGYESSVTQVSVTDGQTEAVFLTLIETETSAITGDVVTDSYEPISGADISLLDADTGDVVATATTGSEGSYTFIGIEYGEYQIEATAGGSSTVATFTNTAGTTNRDLVIAEYTDPTGSVTGTVLTVDNEPIPGAEVALLDASTDEIVGEAMADSDGTYLFTNIETSEYVVQATADGASGTTTQFSVEEDSTADINIVIPEYTDTQGSLSVDVVDEDANTVSDATVELYRGTDTSGTLIATSETDSDGYTLFDELAVGESSSDSVDYTVYVGHPEYSSTVSSASLYAPEQTTDSVAAVLLSEDDSTDPQPPTATLDVQSQPDTVGSGDSFEVTFAVTNTGETDALTGGIQFTTPTGIETDSEFFLDGIEAGATETRTVSFDVADTIEPAEYIVTTEATVGESTDTTSFSVNVGQPQTEITATEISPESVAPGDTVDVELAVTNTGSVDASSGGITFENPTGFSSSPPSVFFVSGVESQQTVSNTVAFTVSDSVSPGDYTVTAEAELAGSSDSIEIPIEIEEDEGLSRFDTDNNGEIEFNDVLNAIDAFNNNAQIGGSDVEFDDILEVISAYNEGAPV